MLDVLLVGMLNSFPMIVGVKSGEEEDQMSKCSVNVEARCSVW